MATKSKENNQELVEKEENLPAISMFEEDAGAGLEGADKSSYAIPFLVMLQGLSPQCETIDEAKPGLILNTITNEVSKVVRVIPCAYQRRFIRWTPRSQGGGFKGEYNPVDVETGSVEGMKLINGYYLMDVPDGVNAFDKDGRPLYDHLADTRMHYVLYETEAGAWHPALISLSSTQIKRSKRWVSRIQGLEIQGQGGKLFNPPSFSHIYTIGAVKEKNQKGEWWSFDIELDCPVAEVGVYAAAKAFNKAVNSGAVEVQQPSQDTSPDTAEDGKF